LSLLDRIRAFAKTPAPEPKQAPDEDEGKGYGKRAFRVGKAPVYFSQDVTDASKCRRMYEQGGLVGEAIDAYPLFMFTNGYVLNSDDEALSDVAQEFLDTIDFETLGHQLVVDALVMPNGRAYAEIVWNKIGAGITGLVYRPAETFKEILDERGNVIQYVQTVIRDNSTVSVELEPKNIFVLDLHAPLVKRAFKEIEIDMAIADSTATSIQRHGYPRYHVKLGQPGENVSEDALRTHGRQFEDLKPNMEWTTTQDVAINNIDTQGITGTDAYTNWSTQRVSSALGVPEEMLGLGRGSTEATAKVRLDTFYDKIGSFQARFARAMGNQIFDVMTGRPGSVWMVFNDVSPEDNLQKAQYIAAVAGIYPTDPWLVMTPTYVQEYLGIEIAEDDPDNPSNKEPEPEPQPIIVAPQPKLEPEEIPPNENK